MLAGSMYMNNRGSPRTITPTALRHPLQHEVSGGMTAPAAQAAAVNESTLVDEEGASVLGRTFLLNA